MLCLLVLTKAAAGFNEELPVTIQPSKSHKHHLVRVCDNGDSNSSYAMGHYHVDIEVHHLDLLGTVLDTPDQHEVRLLHLLYCLDLYGRKLHICDNGAPGVGVASQL